MRAEIRTAPWDVRHANCTEEWFGWNYTFGSDYEIDRNNQWLFFFYPAVVGDSLHTEIMVIKEGQFDGHAAGVDKINGQSLYDRQVATVYSDYSWGGNAK